MIWQAVHQSTAILENVMLDDAGVPDFSDVTLTSNSRAAYPRDVIPNCVPSNMGGVPRSVIFLTCDLYGVLPRYLFSTRSRRFFGF